jgi:hypothetical protein
MYPLKSKGNTVNDMFNTKPQDPVEAPAVKAPEAVAAPEAPVAAAVAPAVSAPAVVAAPLEPAVQVKVEIPQTKGSAPGGWNRFAGYNRNDAKNNKPKGPSKRF